MTNPPVKATKGVLLMNIGTPNSPQPRDVAKYLREFLMDEEILPLPFPLRYLLVNVGIVPRRASKSAKKYQAIWTPQGSPLMVHSEGLQRNLQQLLGPDYHVEFGMRYGEPSIERALEKFRELRIRDLHVLPLYPQYCRATTESSFKKVDEMIQKHRHDFQIRRTKTFWSDPGFIQAVAEETRKHLGDKKVDYYLMTYHGLPQSQNQKMEPGATYEDQCLQNSQLIATALGLRREQWGVSFQSRVGVETWIKPYTDEELKSLPGRGIKNLAVLCPSFVSDCLETLEEIGLEGKETFLHAGGENYYLIPCVNERADYLVPLVQSSFL